jgi:flagellar hook assembly protein FlgD
VLELVIYDLSGRRVRTLQSGRAEPGRHSVSWDLRDASGAPAHAGVYFARLSLGSEAHTRKLVVVR